MKAYNLTLIPSFLWSLLLLCCFSCQEKQTSPALFEHSGLALGTSYQITYISDKPLDLKKPLDSIFLVINQSMSTYWPESDISRINRDDLSVLPDEHLAYNFKKSKEIHRRSFGYFDPTIAPLVNAYGFGPNKVFTPPDSTSIDSLLQLVGLDKIEINANGFLTKPTGVKLDFNAIAKGYTVDVISHYLKSKKLEHFIVEIGGELYASGYQSIKQKPWTLGIEAFNDENFSRDLAQRIQLENKALATSGSYRKQRKSPDSTQTITHIVDPKTGNATISAVLSASVVADDCITADAFATAFMVMPVELILEIAPNLTDIELLIYYKDKEGAITSYETSGFQALKLSN
ncbi:MAG: FAD:protein FMN transferase [Flavobacteriaceae bacterium]|nr:FAD:protein FMN transferase [Flavobacteriaceae bacterium]